jgi:hypothetical protein
MAKSKKEMTKSASGSAIDATVQRSAKKQRNFSREVRVIIKDVQPQVDENLLSVIALASGT